MMNPVASHTNPAAGEAGLRPIGIRSEFLDFRDRSRGLLHPSEIRGEIDRGRFVWLDVDVAEVEADLIETTLPPQACPGVNFRQLVDDHATLRSPPPAALRRTDQLLLLTFLGGAACGPDDPGERLDVVYVGVLQGYFLEADLAGLVVPLVDCCLVSLI